MSIDDWSVTGVLPSSSSSSVKHTTIIMLTVWRPLTVAIMCTAIKHPVSCRIKPLIVILTSGHTDAQRRKSESPGVKNYKWRLNPVWHRILYSCTHTATVGVKRLIQQALKPKLHKAFRGLLYGTLCTCILVNKKALKHCTRQRRLLRFCVSQWEPPIWLNPCSLLLITIVIC